MNVRLSTCPLSILGLHTLSLSKWVVLKAFGADIWLITVITVWIHACQTFSIFIRCEASFAFVAGIWLIWLTLPTVWIVAFHTLSIINSVAKEIAVDAGIRFTTGNTLWIVAFHTLFINNSVAIFAGGAGICLTTRKTLCAAFRTLSRCIASSAYIACSWLTTASTIRNAACHTLSISIRCVAFVAEGAGIWLTTFITYWVAAFACKIIHTRSRWLV